HMGKIDVRSGSTTRQLTHASPELREAVFQADFGRSGGIGVEIEFLAFERGRAASLGQDGSTLTPGAFIERLVLAAGPGAELVRNSRYRIMEHFFAPDSIHKWGNYASAIQVNLDVPGGPAWHEAVQVGFAVSRFAYLMFANSRFLHDRPFEGPSARLALMKGM